jgi:hypothetical protein
MVEHHRATPYNGRPESVSSNANISGHNLLWLILSCFLPPKRIYDNIAQQFVASIDQSRGQHQLVY